MKRDWEEVQRYYDDNHTWNDIIVNLKMSNSTLNKAVKNGLIKMRSKSESVKLACIKNPRVHSEETKKKISDSRKKYLEDNPDKVPYLLNHYSRGDSYPETYFNTIFKNFFEINTDYKMFLQVGLYEIDFAFINNGIAIEIDGSQHRYDKKIKESDKRKDKFLKINGWRVFRINWSDYQKLNRIEKEKFIEDLILLINNKIDDFILIRKDNNNFCVDCGKIIESRSKRCKDCDTEKRWSESLKNKVSYEDLINDVKNIGYSATGRKYGVSDNAIRKWIKKYEKHMGL